MKIYTDGSGNGKVGFIIEDNGEETVKSENIGECTNNVAEYTAVLKALQHIVSNGVIKDKNIDLISDSQLVVNQLGHNWHIKDDTLRELAKAIWDVAQTNQLKVTWKWVRRKENPAGKLLG